MAKVGLGAEFAPIDMGSQEEQKLERKRSRNRVAATKCRKKKLEKISKLEERVQDLKSENTDLGQILKQVCSIFYIYSKQIWFDTKIQLSGRLVNIFLLMQSYLS